MQKVFLGLGSNLGNKEENIKKAVELLSDKIKIEKIARFYISKAYGVENQDDFLNTALVGYTDLKPFELLKFVKKIEKKIGRKKRFHWGPREIDIDILFYENKVIKTKKLKIPHPEIHKRDFVLLPLNDLEPDFIHPVLKKTISQLSKELKTNYIIHLYSFYQK